MTLHEITSQLASAAREGDVQSVRTDLKALLTLDPKLIAIAMDALHERREEAHVAFILDHMNIDHDDDGGWIVSLKGEF